jgi:membrane protease YdiL (CAAX protease family)
MRQKLRRIFIGSNGLRAGWSSLLFIVLFLMLNAIESTILSRFLNSQNGGLLRPAIAFVQESCDLMVVFLATFFMARVENRKVLSYGFTGVNSVHRLASGIVCGLLALSLLVVILWRSHLLGFEGLSLRGMAAWKYGLAWGAVALVVGLFEESLLRGYLQYTLARGTGFWWAAAILSVAFAAWHITNNGESPLGLLVVGLGGFVFCLSLWYTKSLWWAVGGRKGSFTYISPVKESTLEWRNNGAGGEPPNAPLADCNGVGHVALLGP